MPRFIDRETARAYGAGDIGPCCWSNGVCGRPGNRAFTALIEEHTGVEWLAEPDIFYCAVHTPLVVDHAVTGLAANQRVLDSERLTDD